VRGAFLYGVGNCAKAYDKEKERLTQGKNMRTLHAKFKLIHMAKRSLLGGSHSHKKSTLVFARGLFPNFLEVGGTHWSLRLLRGLNPASRRGLRFFEKKLSGKSPVSWSRSGGERAGREKSSSFQAPQSQRGRQARAV